MKKNIFNVLFSKFGVALFFLMFLLWNEGSAQSYVSSAVAKTRLSAQADAWELQVKQNPGQPALAQLRFKADIYQKMILFLDQGQSVASVIDMGAAKYSAHVKNTSSAPVAQTRTNAPSSGFKAEAQGLLTN